MFERPVERWTLITQHFQVMPIALRSVAMPLKQESLEVQIVLALERQRIHILILPRHQQLTRLIRQLLIDPACELADTAPFAEAPRVTQHHHLLRQRMGAVEVLMQAAGLQRFTADRLQPLPSLRAIPTAFSVTAQIPQHGAGLY